MLTEEGKKMMEKSNKENRRACTNCIHFPVCKIFRMMTAGVNEEFKDTSPVDFDVIALGCDFFLNKVEVLRGIAAISGNVLTK